MTESDPEVAVSGERLSERTRWGIRHPAVLEVLRYCIPALLVALALRAAVMWVMPYAYVQYDSVDYLVTAHEAIAKHHFVVDDRRTYLTPLLWLAPFALPVPALISIAIIQHLMGVVGTLLVGGLVRLWFKFWKVAIIPVTVLFAANPGVVWYEHTLLGETPYLFFTLLTVFVGSVLARWPGWRPFAWLVVSLFLVCGARLEAKAFFLFAGLLVVIAFWKQWRRIAIAMGILMLAFAGVTLLAGKREGLYLTYASLIKLAPDHSKLEPGIDRLLIPIRDTARQRYPHYPAELVALDKEVVQMVKAYARELKEQRKPSDKGRILRHLCLEAIAAHPLEALTLPWVKFRLAIDARSSYAFDEDTLWRRQEVAMTRKPWMTAVLSKGLTGQQLSPDNVRAWIRSRYNPDRIGWFDHYQDQWNNALIRFRMPDKPMEQERWVHDFYGGVPDPKYTKPGIPYVYIIAFVGMLAAVWRRSQLGWFHAAWVTTMLIGLYLVSLVGVTNARFRFVYEPFVLLYFFLLFDCIADFFQSRALSRNVDRGQSESQTPAT